MNEIEMPGWRRLLARAVGLGVIFWLCLAFLALAFGIGADLVATAVNNNVTQPLQRSRLDSDADYRRGIEVQARGDVATYQRGVARLPQDKQALTLWLAANPGPNYSIAQSEEYQNLQTQEQGDINAETRAATDYNALVANPDNAGLFGFDPDLPQSLSVVANP